MKNRRTYRILATSLLAVSALAFSGCSTVSEETCAAGNWEAEGFTDGSSGRSVDRLTKVIEGCQKHGFSVDDQAYMAGYERGLPNYCTFRRGVERGQSGSSYNQVCSGELAIEYGPGFEEGRRKYNIYKQHEDMVERYEYKRSRLYELRQRLQDVELTDRQRDSTRRSIRRLEYEIDELRYRIREFRRRHNVRGSDLGRY